MAVARKNIMTEATSIIKFSCLQFKDSSGIKKVTKKMTEAGASDCLILATALEKPRSLVCKCGQLSGFTSTTKNC